MRIRVRMIRFLLLGSLLLLPTASLAEDFTGFYAGVNAGYGWDREEAKGIAPIPRPTGASGTRTEGLPPSASAAAAAFRRGAGRPSTSR